MARHFRRHYRAYKNEVANSFPSQLQNIKRNKGKIIFFVALILVVGFIKSFVFGYLLGRHCCHSKKCG